MKQKLTKRQQFFVDLFYKHQHLGMEGLKYHIRMLQPEFLAGGIPAMSKTCKELEKLGYIRYKKMIKRWGLTPKHFSKAMGNE